MTTAPIRAPAWKIALVGGVTLAILFAIVRHIARTAGPELLHDARWELAPVSLAIATAILILSAIRWGQVLRAMGHPVPFRTRLSVVLATWPPAAVTPSRASDFLRAWGVRDRVPLLHGVGSVLAEKVVDVQSLLLVSAAGLAAMRMWLWSGLALFVLAAMWTTVAVLGRYRASWLRLPLLRRVAPKLEHLYAGLAGLKAPRAFLGLAATSLTAWLLAAALVQSLLHVFGAQVPTLWVLALWPVATLAGLLPISLAGFGTRDAAFVLLLRAAFDADLSAAPVLAATLGYALLGTWLWAIIGVPFMVRLGLGRTLRRQESALPLQHP